MKKVDSGVPQGSLLGPLLFIIFINDIVSENFEHSYVSLFADDTAVACFGDSLETVSRNANNAVVTVQGYCSQNGLVLNQDKTEMMLFSLRDLNKSLLIKFNEKTIEQKSVVKFLGVFIDSKLSWSHQVDHILKKLAVYAFVIWQLRSKVDLSLLKLYYFSYVQSCMTYAIVSWGNCTRANEIFIQQKKIVKSMLFKPLRSPIVSYIKYTDLSVSFYVSLGKIRKRKLF